MTKAKCC